MRKLESAGWIAKLADRVTGYFSSEEYHERVEAELISTLDGFAYWLDEPVKRGGEPYSDKHIQKMVNHFLRQYKANRIKLK